MSKVGLVDSPNVTVPYHQVLVKLNTEESIFETMMEEPLLAAEAFISGKNVFESQAVYDRLRGLMMPRSIVLIVGPLASLMVDPKSQLRYHCSILHVLPVLHSVRYDMCHLHYQVVAKLHFFTLSVLCGQNKLCIRNHQTHFLLLAS